MSAPLGALSARPRERLVAAVGSANDPATWSGIPFHLLRAGLRAGFFDRGLDLLSDRTSIGLRRRLWNLRNVATGRGLGGFQYSEEFLSALWDEAGSLEGSVVVNCFSLYPEAIVRDPGIEKWFYVDQTLTQLFDYYEQRSVIGTRIAEDAIAREREGYRAARGVVVNSRWARSSVIDDYGIDPDKVHVVVPGPSLDQTKVEQLSPKPPRPPVAPGDPLRLVLVGKDWRRKGLDRLLRALPIAREKGAAIALRVIGVERTALPPELRETPDVEWLGPIAKRTEEDRFIEVVRSADVGCLLSTSEAGGIAMREYNSLGLPAIGPATGGAPEHMLEGASIAIAPTASDEEIAQVIFDLATDDEMLRGLTETAWTRRLDASWSSAMRAFGSFWPHGGDADE